MERKKAELKMELAHWGAGAEPREGRGHQWKEDSWERSQNDPCVEKKTR